MDEDEDQYVAQLREEFAVCDTDGDGRLNREQLADLCGKLQLEAQSEALIDYLLAGDQDKEVDFETFKEGFVAVLSTDPEYSIAEEFPSDTEDDVSISVSLHQELGDFSPAKDEISPKFVRNGRRYGRRSRPDINHSIAASDLETDHSSQVEGQSPAKRSKNSLSESFAEDPDRDLLEEAEELESDPPLTTLDLQHLETFEGDGELIASMGARDSPPDEAGQMQKIWRELDVGKDGYLDIDELAIVCEHIGMGDMDREELQNLFNNLDQDGDSRVSFDEFLEGLFKHGGSTPTPRTNSPGGLPSPTHRQRPNRTLDDQYHRAATPSIYVGMQGIKLFTSLDPENSGFAEVDDVLEFWQSQGLQNPLEVLEALDTDMEAGKVNLQELSMALEQVLVSTEEDNDLFQASILAHQGEIKYIRSQLESIQDERDKLKADLSDANQQSTTMLQEVDERHANIEKTHETKLKSVEKKYQDKIQSLQNELAMDRETLTSHAISQRQNLEEELEVLRAEESQLRSRVEVLEKENERLDTENERAAESLVESQKTIHKQQRDLEGFQELEERLAGLETNTDTISKQQIENYEDALRDYQELLRKEQDKVDELTQENELLKHQSSERKVRRRGGNKSQRRPNLLDLNSKLRKQTESSTENDSEFDEHEILSEDRAGGDGLSNTEEEMKKIDAEVAKWEAKVECMREEHDEQLADARAKFDQEMEQARANFEAEFGDMEEKYKVKIIEMEDDFEKERKKLREEVDNEKEKINNQLTELENVLEAEREGLREKYEYEKQDIEIKFESEKENLKRELGRESQNTLERQLEELSNKLIEQKDSEIDALQKELTKERKESEKRIRSLQEELELKLKNNQEDIEGFYKRERDELELKLQEKMGELDSILQDGEAGLQGQLKEDFQELLENHKTELEENFRQEKELLMENLEKEREELKEQYEQERSELNNSVGSERDELLKRMKQEKADLIERSKRERSTIEEKLQRETQRLSEKHERDKDLLRKELEKEKKKLERELQKETDKTAKQLKKEKADLEKELQREREKYKTERQTMEERVAMEMEALRGKHQAERETLESALREKEMEEALQRSAQQNYEEELAQMRRELENEKAEFTADRKELQLQLRAAEVAKEEAVMAVTIQEQQSMPEQLAVKESSYDDLSHKTSLLELNISRLEEKLVDAGEKLEHSKNTNDVMETQLASLKSERNQLKSELDSANRKLMELQMKVTISESQHSRELERVKAAQQKELMAEMQHLQGEIREMENRLREAQGVIREKEEAMGREAVMQQESEEMRTLKQQKEVAERKYKKTRGLLDEYMKKLRQQITKTARSDGLVKDLHIENSKLQKVLQLTEEKQRRVERSSVGLIEKNQAYLGLLKRICPAAV